MHPTDETLIAELLALDLLTLRAHTEQAGDAFDADAQAACLRESMLSAELCQVRRDGRLVAYALIGEQGPGRGFVRGFCIHPQHRNAAVMAELLRQLLTCCVAYAWSELHSHVYKTNQASLDFHQRLGFATVAENAKAFAFKAHIDQLAEQPLLRRLMPG